MPQSGNTPGLQVFPQIAGLYSMVSAEVADLTDQQLDWDSTNWEWAKWSIRRQVSHMAAFIPGWLLRRWGEPLFPQGYHELGELAKLAETVSTREIRWLDENQYNNICAILQRFDMGLSLAQYVLSKETLTSLRNKEVPRPDTPPTGRACSTRPIRRVYGGPVRNPNLAISLWRPHSATCTMTSSLIFSTFKG